MDAGAAPARPARRRARSPAPAARAGARIGARRRGPAPRREPSRVSASPPRIEAHYDARLGGRPGAELRYGRRVIARSTSCPARPVRTTIRPSLQAAATGALGERLGGVAVLRPRDGACSRSPAWRSRRPSRPARRSRSSRSRLRWTPGSRVASETFPVRTAGHAGGRAGAQRRRRGVRRHADPVVRALVQLGLRAARRAARGAAARPLRGGVRLQRAAARSRLPSRARSARRRARGRPRGGRERDRAGPRPRHAAGDGERRRDDRQRRCARAAAALRAPAVARRASSSGGSPARCAT